MNNSKEMASVHVRACVVIPAYDEEERIGQVVEAARRHAPLVIVVDDGSRDATAEVAEKAGALVLRHSRNEGKGAALQTGFQHALSKDCDVVIAMDADGQHNPDGIPPFLEAYRRTGIPVLLGNRIPHMEAMPRIRRWTNRIMSMMISRIMKQYIPDTQCGYRLFRRDVLPYLNAESHRFAAESEILLHLADRGFRIDCVRVSVIYHNEHSNIRPIRDAIRFFRMLYHYRQERQTV